MINSNALRQGAWEFKLSLKNGEQFLLLVIIPVAVFLTLTQTAVIGGGKWDIAEALSVSITVSVLAAGFTSLAIATAFERRSGTLVTMGVTPISRVELVTGKTLSTVYLAAISALILGVVALVLGWRPTLSATLIPLILILGIASVTGFAFLLAGTVRAEAVLALANGIFVFAMIFGGIVFQYSGILGTVIELFPPAALSNCMSHALDSTPQDSLPLLVSIGVLLAWSVAGTLASAKFFKWR
jgi:ABC-2 type transport system permease protein